MKRNLLLMILGLTLSVSIAQNGFTTYSTNISLSATLLKESALIVDNVGNKWVGFYNLPTTYTSTAGLLKYNNTTWTLYNTVSTPALPSNNITALAKDNANNIWIGTLVGLVKFDGTNFTTFDVSNGLPSNTITCIETIGSQVYVGTRFGLSRFDGTNFTNYTVANGKVPSDTITSIKAETPNIIWLGGFNRLMQFNINNTYTSTSYTNNTIPLQPNYIAASGGTINCIYIDANNTKWLGTSNCGITLFNGTAFTNANQLYQNYGGIIPNKVMDLSYGLNNGVALKMTDGLMNSNGIIELAPNGNIFQYFRKVPSNEIGDFIEKDGNELIMTSNKSFNSTYHNIYFSFNKQNYIMPLGTVNSSNFKLLDINNVKAGIANRSDMHWDVSGSGTAMYEVPKGKGINSNFATALWIGGLDNANNLHLGAQTYRQNGVDFWPGPLDTLSATTDSAKTYNYDKIWKVSYTDINNFISNFNSGNVQNGTYTPIEDLVNWPAKGTGNFSRNLAPFVDVNHNGIYDPLTGGDYPQIKGDQALYFIYNDNLSAHQATGCLPMGIEVQAMAYAYGCPSVVSGKPELTYTTFYDYKIINRSSANYHDVYVSMWSDADLGYYADDYIGCNVADNYGYMYNADNFDESLSGPTGYGSYPPAQGFAIMKGPLANANDGTDNNNNGIIDEPNEDCKLDKFTYWNNGFAGVPLNTTDPQTCFQYRNYMSGFWKDSTAFACGGNAYGGTTPANWSYTGDVNTGISTATNSSCGAVNWTEISAGNVPGDRRLIVSSGPFNFNAGQMQEVEYAFVTSFDSTSTTNSNLLSVAKLKTDIQNVRAFYNLVNKPNCLQSITIGVKELLKPADFILYPNPTKSTITVNSAIEGDIKIDYEIVDLLGKSILKNESNHSQFSINIGDFTAGVYFLRIKINNSMVVKKIIKE